MEVNSIKKVFNLINSLNVEDSNLNFTIRKIDYCYELNVGDYTIYFEDNPYDKDKYLEINYECIEDVCIKLNKRNTKLFRLIFKLLITNYLRNRALMDYPNN